MTDRSVMVTGPRQIDNVLDVQARIAAAYRLAGATLAVTGGAERSDVFGALAAIDAGIPFDVLLPNWAYRLKYPQSISDHLLEQAREVRYVVERPVVDDWKQRWGDERWWVDNFARNHAMIEVSQDAVVVNARHPRDLLDPEVKGGTAHCVKALFKAGFGDVWWVPDSEDGEVERVSLSVQPSLFGGN